MPSPLVLCLVAAVASSSNGHLNTARGLVRGVRYAAALAELKQAEAREGNSTAEITEIYELEGLAHSALKHTDEARKAFTRLLALNPQHKFATQQAPRVMTPYLEARAQVQENGGLQVIVGAPETVEGGFAVTLTLNDFLGLAKTVAVKLVEDAGPRELSLPAAPSLRVEAHGEHAGLNVEVLSEHRAVLATLPRQVIEAPRPAPAPASEPFVAEAPPPPPPVVEARSERSVAPMAAAIALVVVGAGALGTGAYFGVTSKSARSQYDSAVQTWMSGSGRLTLSYADAMALQHTAQTNAVIADILFAAGGALALVGVGIGIGGLVLSPAPGGVSVSGSMP
jgi:hypothetical protein